MSEPILTEDQIVRIASYIEDHNSLYEREDSGCSCCRDGYSSIGEHEIYQMIRNAVNHFAERDAP